ncbi:uncharacterized protein FIBRA_02703 [Fibroporia radiculosa]|uniref:YVC1 N-terminal linker helical domain-containing protein n=1 Tax=Fibroporia radiculosa TaxID=599839 RepID=J4H201_9APHY|nr:uncharacterized protein FIBRA_02703 [Fibroporia radiculosa]CCM00664.1 predicted protein [Fibroporia radiculosa]
MSELSYTNGQDDSEAFHLGTGARRHPSPDTVTSVFGLSAFRYFLDYHFPGLIRRVRALTLRLLPVEVPPENIADPTSRVITSQVVDAYVAAAGDFTDVLPYCLLQARKEFLWDATNNPADWGENHGRGMFVLLAGSAYLNSHRTSAFLKLSPAPSDKVVPMLSTRFRHKEIDDDYSEKSSALEAAFDSHCTIFLSSTEAQDVVNYLWRGQLVQKHGDDHDVDFVPYKEYGYHGFWVHFDPGRLSVPRYQNIFRILVWIFFLITYSQAVREPLDKLNPDHSALDIWEIFLYVLALSLSFEDIHKVYKLFLFVSWRSLGFWDVVSTITDSLLVAAFVLRVMGIASSAPNDVILRTRSFQCLSFSCLILWGYLHRMKLVPVFDGFQPVGTMQICVARMLKESGIFFGLLAILGVGFMQGLYALDAADGQSDHPYEVIHALIQALLQSPNYDMFSASSSGQILFYFWNVATAVILLNVLISLFSSAYDDVVGDAAAEYLTYFAGKVGGMIRAPDDYVYPAPFNLVEIFFVAPLESCINRYVMLVLFFIPLSGIALYEAELEPSKNRWIKDWFSHPDEGGEPTPEFENPDVHPDDAARGLEISKVSFDKLVQAFPDTTHSSEAVLVAEIRQLKDQMEELKQLLINKS